MQRGFAMHNDSKLGLLAGVAGVVVAAVLAAQNPAAGPASAGSPSARAAASPTAMESKAGSLAKVPTATTPVGARGRAEVEGTTASRGNRDDDE
jgi:hypothetical protein